MKDLMLHLMNVDKQSHPIREKLKIAGACAGVFCILALPCIIQERWIRTDQAYQKGLAWMYGTMPLVHYQCASIRSDPETKETWVYFTLDRFDRFSLTAMFYTKDRGAAEIARIQKRTMDYLQNHPESELNSQRITLRLQELPGEEIELVLPPA